MSPYVRMSSVGLPSVYVIISIKGGKLHFYATIGALFYLLTVIAEIVEAGGHRLGPDVVVDDEAGDLATGEQSLQGLGLRARPEHQDG